MKEISVIVVDDELNILNSLRRLFKDENYGVFTTSDSAEALKCLNDNKVKVFISDQRMPNINGVDLLKQVKDAHPNTMRILFTGYTDLKIAEDAINKGEVYRFINKPWDDKELLTIVRDSIERFDLGERNRQMALEIQNQNTELITLNTKLKNMYEAQKAFSSTVSHELRTPLCAMKALIDIVLSGTAGDLTPDQKNFLQRASSNVDRLSRLINDILNLEKLESGKATLKLERHDLNELIREVIEVHQPVAAKRGLELKCELASEKSEFMFDSDRMNQVLSNLVSNAIKFTETGGITVSCLVETEKNCVSVSVKDTGFGIKDEDKAKLFQKFQQLGNPAEISAGGTGLGLAICREIIGQHGGKIWIESEFGHGSAFCFVLPIEERREGQRE
jgi:signal transduction histidine kinase